jgi:hypothetical protein
MHIHGNFTVQNLIEVLARIHRLLSYLAPQSAQQYTAIEQFKRKFRGLDPYSECQSLLRLCNTMCICTAVLDLYQGNHHVYSVICIENTYSSG